MRIRFFVTAVLTSVLLAVSACSSIQSARHEYLMRGQVLEVNANEVVICVGSSDGAQMGQELTAYMFDMSTPMGRGITPYRRVQTGTVRISEVLDEHFAKARITSGSPVVHNVVELIR